MARSLFIAILLFGVAVAVTFHASGAVSALDARMAVAVDGSLSTSPPHPVSARVLALGADLVRVVWAPTGLFRALHLAAGLILALAAAMSARVAWRGSAGRGASGLAGAVFVGLALVLGGDTARLGLSAHPVPVLLALLAGSAWAWSASVPRPLLGGVLLGLATADHALVLFLLPGFGAFALLATLRMSPARGGQFLRLCAAGWALGFLAVFLPWLASDHGISHVVDVRGPLGAIGAWWHGAEGAFWHPGGPHRWLHGAADLARALWRNTGPLGILLGVAGLAAFLSGAARSARPFLIVHGILAAAVVLGTPRDAGTAAALLGWSFLFWAVPALARIEMRLAAGPGGAARAAATTPILALAGAGALFAVSFRGIDHSDEAGVTWARTVLDTLPDAAVLVSGNPVTLALAADGVRADLDVIDVDDASTLSVLRSGRPLLPLGATPPRGPVDAARLRELVEAAGGRAVFLGPEVFFDAPRRAALLGDSWMLMPHGLAFRVAPIGAEMSAPQRSAAALAWQDVPIVPDTPTSPLRDGLTGAAYFARSLVQSAYLHLEQGRTQDAEREFLLALGHPAVNRNLAAMGLARLLFEQDNYREVVRTLDECVRDEQDGAWLARRFEANTLLRLGERPRALALLRRALALTPGTLQDERARLVRLIREVEAGGGTTEGGPAAGSAG